MKTLQTLIALLMSALLPTSAIAQDFTVKGQTIVRSRYVGFDDGLLLYPKGVLQGNLTLAHKKSGLFAELWYSSGFNTDWSQSWDDELDYTVGWGGKVKNLDLILSLTYFDNHNIGTLPFNDVIKGFVRLGFSATKINECFSITPFGSYTGYFIPDNETPFEGGNIFALGVDSELTLAPWLKVASTTAISWNDGAFGVRPGTSFRHTSTLNIPLSKNWIWNALETSFYVPLGNRNMKNEVVLGTGLSWSL